MIRVSVSSFPSAIFLRQRLPWPRALRFRLFAWGLALVLACMTVPLTLTTYAAESDLSGSILIVGNGPERYEIEDYAGEFEKTHPNVFIDFFWHPNAKPVKTVRAGEADIAITGISVEEKGLRSTTIAWDGIAVAVNFVNPVESMTTQQLADIFSGKLKFWSEVMEEAPQTRIVLINRASNQNIRQSFEQQLGITGKTPRTKVVGPEVSAFKTVNGELGGITYASITPALQAKVDGYGVHLLFINGIELERPTILDRTYPLQKPVVFVTQAKPKPLAEAFVQYMLSKKGQRLVRRGRYFPLEVD